jgi:hypothetical protein
VLPFPVILPFFCPVACGGLSFLSSVLLSHFLTEYASFPLLLFADETIIKFFSPLPCKMQTFPPFAGRFYQLVCTSS